MMSARTFGPVRFATFTGDRAAHDAAVARHHAGVMLFPRWVVDAVKAAALPGFVR